MTSHLLNGFQRGFPIEPRPYAAVARLLGTDEDWVLESLAQHLASGTVARVGPVFAPNCAGAGTLAALSVPETRLADVAARVSAHPAVTHNYARDHAWNLWFVASAADAGSLACALREIAAAAACGPLLDLRLEEEFHIDLGFDLHDSGIPAVRRAPRATPRPAPLAGPALARASVLARGLPLTRRPFADIAQRAGDSEQAVLESVAGWVADGVVRRFGVVLRHGELGYRANAMAVWDVPDDEVSARGEALASIPGVTLCYRRRRAAPVWPYNLYCMIHSRTPETVDAVLGAADDSCGLAHYPSALLRTRARYKQCGPLLWRAGEAGHA